MAKNRPEATIPNVFIRMFRLLFPIIALTVLGLIFGYVGWRTISPSRLSAFWKRGLWALLAVLWLLPPLPIFLRRLGNENLVVDVLSWVAYVNLGFFVLAFTLLVGTDLTRLVLPWLHRALTWILGRFTGAGRPEPALDIGRRRFLAYPVNLGLLGVSGALSGYGLHEAIKFPSVVRVQVPLPNLPPGLEGFRIVQLTDIHIGPMIKHGFMRRVVERANALEPDMIALTGDLADGSVPHLKNAVAPLADLAARHGSFFVTGNHEYYSGAEPWVEEMDRLGMQVLLNGHRVLNHGPARLLVAGVTDPNGAQYVPGHKPDLTAAVSGASPADFRLLLAHQPRAIYAAARNRFDLQLSGHTHGGQFIPWNIVVSLTQPYLKGLHLHQNTWIYVSRGTGYWGPPMRLGTQSEITLIELTSRPLHPLAQG